MVPAGNGRHSALHHPAAIIADGFGNANIRARCRRFIPFKSAVLLDGMAPDRPCKTPAADHNRGGAKMTGAALALFGISLNSFWGRK
jgi:hypothetical protein